MSIFILAVSDTMNAQDHRIENVIKNKPGKRIEHVLGTQYSVTDELFNTSTIKDLGEFLPLHFNKSQRDIDSTIIAPSDSDSTRFDGIYEYWQDVDAACAPGAPFVGDINNNGRAEIYGSVITFEHELIYEKVGPLAYYELQTNGLFVKKFQFPYPRREIFAVAIVDIDNDGINELHVRSSDSLKPPWDTLSQFAIINKDRFMKQPDDTSLAIQPFFKWPRDTSFIRARERQTWGDFDRDGKKEVVFISNSHRYTLIILEYNPDMQYLDSIYAFDPQTYTQGFSIGDFDGDGNTDIVMGSIGGKVFVLENAGNNSYRNVWTGQVETYNAYMHFWTHDIDGNGKPEFWVGGDAFYSGRGITRFTCFESDGNDSYHPVAKIDIQGIFSFYAGNAFSADVNKDGTEEIGICLDWNFFLLQFTGSTNRHSYSLIYHKVNEFASYPEYPGELLGGMLFDVDNDKTMELLISYQIAKPSIFRSREFVRVYKQYKQLGVYSLQTSSIPNNCELLQNYPNPFNASTTISYRLNRKTSVELKIFSILGKEIKTILNDVQPSGEYKILWDGSDNNGNNVSSGIYFARLTTPNLSNTKKLLLLR